MSHSNFKLLSLQTSRKVGGGDRINHSEFHGETCKYALVIMPSNKVPSAIPLKE
jgi:hypothetical protein